MSLRTVGLHLQCSFFLKKVKNYNSYHWTTKIMHYLHTQVYFQLQYSPFTKSSTIKCLFTNCVCILHADLKNCKITHLSLGN